LAVTGGVAAAYSLTGGAWQGPLLHHRPYGSRGAGETPKITKALWGRTNNLLGQRRDLGT
jgi:hypothetical protein